MNFKDFKKNWVEWILAGTAVVGIVCIGGAQVAPVIAVWWAGHWVFVEVAAGIGLLGGSAHKWVPLGWKAYTAISDRADVERVRELHYTMLTTANTKMEQGFDTNYENEVHGFKIGMHNPYMKGQFKIQEVPGQQSLPAPAQLPKAPVYREVDPLISDQKLVLCYTQEGPVYGTVADLLSMCVVGKPGRGKSTALLYYILILLKAGAEVWIWDPHSGLNELGYGLNYQDDLAGIESTVPILHSQLEQRRKLWKEKKQVMNPLLLLVDEMPVIADYENDRIKEVKTSSNKKEAQSALLEYDQFYRPSRLLKKFVLEARKWNCYVILSGQALPAEVLNTLTRDNMSSRIVFESCNMHAKMAGLQKEQIDNLLPSLKGAGPGVAVMDVSRWSTPVLAAIPNTTIEDLRAFIDRGKSDEPFNEDESDFQPLSWVSGDLANSSNRGEKLRETGNLESAVKEAEKIVESIPQFSSEDESQILDIARVHLATYGRVIRSKIPASMNPPRNNAIYPAVKYICDREGL